MIGWRSRMLGALDQSARNRCNDPHCCRRRKRPNRFFGRRIVHFCNLIVEFLDLRHLDVVAALRASSNRARACANFETASRFAFAPTAQRFLVFGNKFLRLFGKFILDEKIVRRHRRLNFQLVIFWQRHLFSFEFGFW